MTSDLVAKSLYRRVYVFVNTLLTVIVTTNSCVVQTNSRLEDSNIKASLAFVCFYSFNINVNVLKLLCLKYVVCLHCYHYVN